MKLKILVHQPRFSYYVGGGEVIPLFQARSLSKLGHHVELLTSEVSSFSKLFIDFCKENPNIKVNFVKLPEKYQYIYREIPGKNWSRWDEEALYFGQASERFYVENIGKFNLVITHLLSDSMHIPNEYFNISRLHGVPSEARSFDRIFLKRPNAFVPDCKSVRDGWIKLYPELNKLNMPVAYNGVDSELFKNKDKQRDIDLLYVGRFLIIKGIYNILEAVSSLKRRGVAFNKLMMVGHGPEEAGMRKFIKKENLNDKVEIVKPLSQNELVKVYNKALIFLGPSYAKEGVISTILEAASCGAVIITANACGMPEFAKHMKNSLVIEPKNSAQLANYIRQLMENSSLREKLTKKARSDIEQRWDVKVTNKKLSDIYSAYVKNE